MKLWQLKSKLRLALDRMHFPLVTRRRFKTMQDNLETELLHAETVNNTLRSTLLQVREEIAKANAEVNDLKVKVHSNGLYIVELEERVSKAEKNDHRDPESGRFIKEQGHV